MDKVYTGVVKKVMDKGFGFIKCDELGKDVFYHNNNLPANLKNREVNGRMVNGLVEGEKITFSVEMGPKGENAVNINLAGEASAQETQEEFAA